MVVPAATAQSNAAPQTRQNWDYFCHAPGYSSRDDDEITAMAKQAGAQGWEMVGMDGPSGVFCFKRPI